MGAAVSVGLTCVAAIAAFTCAGRRGMANLNLMLLKRHSWLRHLAVKRAAPRTVLCPFILWQIQLVAQLVRCLAPCPLRRCISPILLQPLLLVGIGAGNSMELSHGERDLLTHTR